LTENSNYLLWYLSILINLIALKYRWYMGPAEVNAYYAASFNEICNIYIKS